MSFVAGLMNGFTGAVKSRQDRAARAQTAAIGPPPGMPPATDRSMGTGIAPPPMAGLLGMKGVNFGFPVQESQGDGGAPPGIGPAPRAPGGYGTSGDALRDGIIETARATGADPLDLATAMSFETGGTFAPRKKGPTTQWGRHQGFIQFGEPQARQHGADFSSDEAAMRSQLGADGAVARYLRASGFKPGMSGLDLYSTINAGSPGRYGASDANNGGTRGDVRDKWENQMEAHRKKAMAILGYSKRNS